LATSPHDGIRQSESIPGRLDPATLALCPTDSA